MSYPTRRDYSWLIDRDGAPASPLPLQQDAKDFSLPHDIDERIHPVFDAYGWQRYLDAQEEIFTGTNVDFIQSSSVPAGRLRYIIDISISTSNNLVAFTVSLDIRVNVGAVFVGTIPPLVLPVGTGGQRFSPGRSFVLAPFDSLVFRSSALVGIGETFEMRYRFVDIPVGEYIPPR